jgi:hypothetical protein
MCTTAEHLAAQVSQSQPGTNQVAQPDDSTYNSKCAILAVYVNISVDIARELNGQFAVFFNFTLTNKRISHNHSSGQKNS